MSSTRRPEHQNPPEIYYNEEEAQKYTSNSRMMEIQEKMSERAIELLNLPEDFPCLILDIGCGSGLSGQCLSEQGHTWIGIDISQAMLDVAVERETDGDLLLSDMGQGLPFRAGTFNGAISISALQWLCNADKKSHVPAKRLFKFFTSLYACLSKGSRTVFQFYPENGEQVELITQQAMKAGFAGGLVVDFPNSTKAKKYYEGGSWNKVALYVLFTDGAQALPAGLGTEGASQDNQAVKYISKRERIRKARGKPLKNSKEWILAKKERRRRQGKEVRPDSKYTARKRSGRF